jgi:hypothetical protein
MTVMLAPFNRIRPDHQFLFPDHPTPNFLPAQPPRPSSFLDFP